MMPPPQLSYPHSDSSETETDSDEDPGTLLIPISQPSTTAPAQQPALKPLNGAKPSLSPLKSNFRKDEAWLVRPAAETVYERLDQYFPDHNLDEPMIDAASPTDSSESRPLESQVSADPPLAKDQKKENQAALLRRRSTKLWGSRVEELPMHAHAQDIPPVPSIPELNNVSGEEMETLHMRKREEVEDGEDEKQRREGNRKIEEVEQKEKEQGQFGLISFYPLGTNLTLWFSSDVQVGSRRPHWAWDIRTGLPCAQCDDR